MRKQVLRSLRETFKRSLESRGRFLQAKKSDGSCGSDVYVWEFSPDLNFFVYLLPSPKSYRDTFMVELGWSSGPLFPRNAPMQNKQRLDLCVDGRIRLPSLWREEWKSALEPWWEAGNPLTAYAGDEFYTDEETARRVAKVPELAADAIGKIETYAIPFFRLIAAEHQR